MRRRRRQPRLLASLDLQQPLHQLQRCRRSPYPLPPCDRRCRGTSPTPPSTGVRIPPRSAVVSGNIIDLTYAGENARPRAGITVDASEVTVADNQIYVRGSADPRVTGIVLREPALNLNVHDNLIRNCGVGLRTGRVASSVTEVLDPVTFREASLPLEWRFSHLYRDWNVVWLSGGAPAGTSVIEAYDPATLKFTLHAPRPLKVGDAFEVYPPAGSNWSLHHNTITGCLTPVTLDSYGSETSAFADNTLSRGEAAGVKAAVTVRGRFPPQRQHLLRLR